MNVEQNTDLQSQAQWRSRLQVSIAQEALQEGVGRSCYGRHGFGAVLFNKPTNRTGNIHPSPLCFG